MKDYDTIIMGGGCSGLSLAIQLANKEPQKPLLILESRPHYLHDRTWSFWDVEPHPFENQVKHRWNQWSVRHRGHHLVLNSSSYRYCSIPSDSFYQEAVKQISQLPHVTLLMGHQVVSVSEAASGVSVVTDQGKYRCHKAFDSRPEKTRPSLYQHFLGWQIFCDQPLFDPQTVTLMDFDVDQSQGLHFIYMLPYSPKEALIESTFISPHPHEEKIYEDAISTYLKERFKTTSYQIIRKERGILPLTTDLPRRVSNHVIHIGAKAGWTRASTGYAFLPIQKAIQNLLADQHQPRLFATERYLDQIFLAFLHMHPQEAPEVFFNLFHKNSPDTMVRFLTGHWRLKELAQVLLTMPKSVMIKQALKLLILGKT